MHDSRWVIYRLKHNAQMTSEWLNCCLSFVILLILHCLKWQKTIKSKAFTYVHFNLFPWVWDPIYTGPDKVLNWAIFYLCNQLARNRTNSVTDSSIAFRSKTYTVPRINEKRIRADFIFVRSQICPDSCKHGLSFMNSSCTLRYWYRW